MAYSAIEHLAKTLWLGEWRSGEFTMLSAAFDASGSDHDQPILVVAGFLSSVQDWIDFDARWKERLALDGIAYFHASEFANSLKQFEGWRGDERRRRALLGDLVDIIKSHVHQKFGCLIVNTIHNAGLSQQNREAFYLEAYPLAGRSVAGNVNNHVRSFNARWFPELVFEDGDLNKGKLMERLKEDGYPPPIFKPKKDTVDKKSGVQRAAYTPLQAADLWAYELFLADKQKLKDEQTESFRWAFEQLSKIPGESGFYSEKDIARTDTMLTAERTGSTIIDPDTGAYIIN